MAKGKEKKGNKQKPIEETNTAEMIVRAMSVFSDRNVSIEKRHRMIAAIESILAEPDMPEPQPDEPKLDDTKDA
jgi:hypothetical protein